MFFGAYFIVHLFLYVCLCVHNRNNSSAANYQERFLSDQA